MDGSRRTGIGRWFAIAAGVEAVTWLGLLVGMYLKYVSETTDAGVMIFGRLHGAAFIAYVIVTFVAAGRLPWSWKVTTLALAASIPPLTTLVFEVGAERRGLLDEAATSPAPA
jgi:integral membrane protein